MSLRYRLDKDRFKGKKLPPKIKTNEDHVSEDQRGDHSALDDPLSDGGIKYALKQKLAQETDQMSRRGLFSGLNKLKEYHEETEAREKPAPKKKKRKVKRKRTKPEDETSETAEEPGTVEETADEALETESVEAEPTPETGKPRKGFFKRMSDRFFPSLHEEPEPVLKPKPKAAPKPESQSAISEDLEDEESGTPEEADPIYGMAPTDVVEEARQRVAQEQEEPTEEEKALDRRNMIRQSVHFFAKPAMDKVQDKIDTVNRAMDQVTKRPPLLRPPGAISEQAFLKACTRCDKCIQACPKDAIKKVPKKMGWIIMETPYIDPMKKPCMMCEDLPCISACQDEALLPVATLTDVNMGYAILDKKHCVAYGDGFCQQCVIECPVPGAIIQKNDRPIIQKDICTGCGACVRACATVNIPVALKIKPQMVIEAQLRKKEREQEEAEMAERMEAERQRLIAEREALLAEQAELAKEKGWSEEDAPDA